MRERSYRGRGLLVLSVLLLAQRRGLRLGLVHGRHALLEALDLHLPAIPVAVTPKLQCKPDE